MLTLLVPVLITYLLEPSELKAAKRQTVQLHDNSLQWLKKIGPKYPEVCSMGERQGTCLKNVFLFTFQEFKTLMTQSPVLKLKLEQAIRNSQVASQYSSANNSQSKMKSNMQKIAAPNPTIKLKTDFSNFS